MVNQNNRFFFREAVASEEDFLIYLHIKSDAEAVRFSGFTTAPDPERFHKVYDDILNDSKRHLLYLCDKENNNAVAATFHYRENDEETVEGLGYNVFPEYRGMSIGGLMMKLVNEKCASEGFKYRLSYVAENNIPSIKNLEKSGAYPTGKVEYREWPSTGEKVKYLEYVKEL